MIDLDPYNRENIERVKRDEAQAQAKERAEEDRLADGDRKEQLYTLRAQRHNQQDGSGVRPANAQITTKEGHLNFWQDCELNQDANETRQCTAPEPPIPSRARTNVELNPWYANKQLRNGKEQEKNQDQVLEDCYRDTALKSEQDPLRSIQAHFSAKQASKSSRTHAQRPASTSPIKTSFSAEREEREKSERERAAHLLAKHPKPHVMHEPKSLQEDTRATNEPNSDELWAEIGDLHDAALFEHGDESFSSLDEEVFTTFIEEGNSLDATISPDSTAEHEQLVSKRWGRESMYVELLQDMICVVLEYESHLFTERELNCLSHIFLLPYEARYLLVRLLQRNREWYRIDRLAYGEEISDLKAACTALCGSFDRPISEQKDDAQPEDEFGSDHDLYRFAMTDTEISSNMRDRLDFLTLDELKTLAKRLGLPRRTTRESILHEILAKPKNATFFTSSCPGTLARELRMDANASQTRLEKEIAALSPGCIRLVPEVCRLMDRLALIYYRARPTWGSLLTAAVLARSHKWRFPTYHVQRTPDLFLSRSQVLRFEHALRLEEAMDQQVEGFAVSPDAAQQGVAILEIALPLWQKALADVHQTLPDDQNLSPECYVRMRFHPGWVLTRVLYKGCECLARLGHRQRERDLLTTLLAQWYFRRGRRGQWHERLAILAAKPREEVRPEDAKRSALARCVIALQDQYTHLIYQFSLQRRIERLENQLKIPLNLRHNFAHNQLRSSKQRIIHGTRVTPPAGRTSARSLWLGKSGASITVEEFCLESYAKQNFRGFHCEGGVVLFLFTLLMWDVLFAPVDGAFETAYQREPLDLATDVFAIARHEAIQQRLSEIESTGGIAILQLADKRERPLRTHAVTCRWDDYSAEELMEIAECMGGKALALLCRLLSEEWSMRTSGFPDLCLWRYADRRVSFVEVKSPNDRLSEKQRVWIDVLIRAGLNVEVARVEDLRDEVCVKKRRRSA
ncbi:phosphodiesterase I [Malassezia yamatoensis]|uniref:Fanconi-associated nuclease n=1 Tax=Malassezia yamatoensis TaxID=253288 RepID=A0AAJ6CIQ9_9BASI|nr:phosphodiesterase I [Malassezia yamatoensis]